VYIAILLNITVIKTGELFCTYVSHLIIKTVGRFVDRQFTSLHGRQLAAIIMKTKHLLGEKKHIFYAKHREFNSVILQFLIYI
jgi:hypothetical protein